MATTFVNINEKLNLVPGYEPPLIVKCSQYDGDYTRSMRFRLYNLNSEYTIPNETKVILSGTKPDSKGFSYECTYDGSVVIAPITRQMTIAYGNVICDISLFNSSNNQIGSANFILFVEKAPLQISTVESSNDFQAMMQYVEDCKYYSNLAYISSKTWAVGGTGARTGEDTDNSKYYSQLSYNNAKTWAVGGTGTRTGEDTDNSEYYSKQSLTYSDLSKSWAVGGTGARSGEDTDNSKYYSQLSKDYMESTKTAKENALSIINLIGTPLAVSQGDLMVNQDRIYVYVGNEPGYQYGTWYYYDTTSSIWKPGGIYNSTADTFLVFLTIQDMQQSSLVKNGMNIACFGRDTYNDGYIEFFHIRSLGSGETADDKELYHLNDNTLCAERIHYQDNQYCITPQMYGAVADGETDITSILNSMPVEGRVVYFPEGEYYITNSIEWKNCTVIGDRNAIIHLVNNSTHVEVFSVDYANFFSLSGLHLISSGFGVKAICSKNITITNLRTECNSYSLYFGGASGQYSENIHISDCVITTPAESSANTKDGIHLNGYNRYIYIDNVIGYTGDDFIALNSSEYILADQIVTGDIHHVFVNNCTNTYGGVTGTCAVRIHGRGGNDIHDVHFRNCDFYAIAMVVRVTNEDNSIYNKNNPLVSVKNLTFENCKVTCGRPGDTLSNSRQNTGFMFSGGSISDVLISNCKYTSNYSVSTTIPRVFVQNDGSDIGKLTISNFICSNIDSIVRTSMTDNRNVTVDKIVLENCNCSRTVISNERYFQAFDMFKNTTLNTLKVCNCSFSGYSGFTNVPANSNLHNLLVSCSDIDVFNFLTRVDGANIYDVKISDSTFNIKSLIVYHGSSAALVLSMHNNNITASSNVQSIVFDSADVDITGLRFIGDVISSKILVNGRLGDSYNRYLDDHIERKRFYDGTEWRDITQSTNSTMSSMSIHGITRTIEADETHVAITAPEVDNYVFVCWIGLATNGWSCNMYIQNMTVKETYAWVDDKDLGEGGQFNAWALYRLGES